VALSAGLLAHGAGPAPVPAALSGCALRAALSFPVIADRFATAQALTLATGVLRTMLLEKVKSVAAAVLAVAVLIGAGGLAYHGLAGASSDKVEKKPRVDKDAIQGAWKVVKVVEDGEDASDTDNGKTFRSKALTITAERIVLKGVFEMTYKLDPASKPRSIDLDNGGGKTFDGVYTLEGNTLTICGPLSPGDARPREVASKKGSKTRLLVLKREVKDRK
jgi:uncharacterized protein (TIGR03067 family)